MKIVNFKRDTVVGYVSEKPGRFRPLSTRKFVPLGLDGSSSSSSSMGEKGETLPLEQ